MLTDERRKIIPTAMANPNEALQSSVLSKHWNKRPNGGENAIFMFKNAVARLPEFAIGRSCSDACANRTPIDPMPIEWRPKGFGVRIGILAVYQRLSFKE